MLEIHECVCMLTTLDLGAGREARGLFGLCLELLEPGHQVRPPVLELNAHIIHTSQGEPLPGMARPVPTAGYAAITTHLSLPIPQADMPQPQPKETALRVAIRLRQLPDFRGMTFFS